MNTIHAVFQGGVFKPIEPVCLPENCEVEFEPRVAEKNADSAELLKVYDILDRRFDSGESNVAQRHDEHQP